MQLRVDATRSAFTSAQVEAIIKTDSAIKVGRGMDLLDYQLRVIDDLTPFMRDCTVTHDNLATVPGSCTFSISRQLAWGSALVRPYVTLNNGVNLVRFNMGAYYTSTPVREMDRSPVTFSVTGYDVLTGLNNLVGDSYVINTGDSYLTAVENIFLNQGYTDYVIDQSRASTTAPSPKAWPIDASTTWLQIVNELLAAVGYRNVFSDWDGRLTCQPFIDPATRNAEWFYTRGQYDGQLVPGGQITHDYFATPNRWVGIQGNVTDSSAALTEGAGVYTYSNATDGETSIEARGRTITKVVSVTAADQTALQAAVMAQVSADKTVGTTVEISTSVNPLHWHNDILSVETIELGVVRVQETKWSMELIKGGMQHSWAVL